MPGPSRRFAALVLILASLPCESAWAQNRTGDPRPPAGRRPFAKAGTPRREERIRYVDVKHIKAELTLDTKQKEVRGTVTHTFSPLHPNLTRVELDCGPELKVAKVTKRAPGKDPVACSFATAGSKLTVAFDRPHGPGETLDLAIYYSGSPTRGLRFVVTEPAYPERPLAIWTQGESEDTHYWLPCYDYPNERATSEMIITVDQPLYVVSNGDLLETTKNAGDTTTYHWKMAVPHVSYLISLAVGEFAVFHDKVGELPVDYYVAKNVDEATARRFMGKTPKMIRFFAESIGEPYPYTKYAQTCLPDFGGGMENISATSMTDSALRDEIAGLEGDADGLVAHELAHQWFGDLLTCKDWSHIWLNEGFASYFDPLFAAHDRGQDAFRLDMEGALKSYLDSDRTYRRPIVETRYESSTAMFDGMTYAKGACVLHMLRGLLGDSVWWKGMRSYVAAHKLQVVETDDFRKAMEAASGKDLKWFFDQWVYKAGHPQLKVRWRYENDDRTVRVKVEQTQTVDSQTPLFRLPTSLEITEDAGKARVVPILIDAVAHEFAIPCPAPPTMVQIDPECWLTKELDFEKTETELFYQLDHAGCVLGRLAAARALAKTSGEKPEVVKALSAAWKREKTIPAGREIVSLLGTGAENSRAALLLAAADHEAKIRVAAIEGLTKLKHDVATEALLRATWSKPKEAYGARKAALRGLVAWKVKDADRLLDDALKIRADRHSIAATALHLILETPGPKARELAALYSQYGQPAALRSEAVGALARLAKDDEALEDILVSLVDDPDRFVRFRSWGAIRDLKLKKASGALKARLGQEATGFNGFGQRMLEETLEALGEKEAAAASTAAVPKPPTIADLDRQAADLESKARDLRARINELKSAARPAAEAKTSASSGSH